MVREGFSHDRPRPPFSLLLSRIIYTLNRPLKKNEEFFLEKSCADHCPRSKGPINKGRWGYFICQISCRGPPVPWLRRKKKKREISFNAQELFRVWRIIVVVVQRYLLVRLNVDNLLYIYSMCVWRESRFFVLVLKRQTGRDVLGRGQ